MINTLWRYLRKLIDKIIESIFSIMFSNDRVEKSEVFWKVEDAQDIECENEFLSMLRENPTNISKLNYMPAILDGEIIGGKPTKLNGIKFEDISFNFTKLKNFNFQNCEFTDVKFILTKISNCEFHHCKFNMCNFMKADITSTYVNPDSFSECLDKRCHQNIGVHLYQRLMKNYKDEEQIQFMREAQYKFNKWERYLLWYKTNNAYFERNQNETNWNIFVSLMHYMGKMLGEICFGYGIRFKNMLFTMLFVILIFSIINCYLRDHFGIDKISDFWDSLYYTIISLTTLGYGDITPTKTLGRFFAAFQSLVGFSSFAVFASMLYRKIAP